MRPGDRTPYGLARDAFPEWKVWRRLKQRCSNPNEPNFHLYGGRGISLCERWQSFENFLRDMGPRPSLAHSIDRINVDGNYEPANCRWATATEQARNRRNSVFLTVAGERVHLHEAAERHGLDPEVVRERLKSGWTVDEALRPKLPYGVRIMPYEHPRAAAKLGKDAVRQIIASLASQSDAQLARQFGVTPSTVKAIRQKRSWRNVWAEVR